MMAYYTQSHSTSTSLVERVLQTTAAFLQAAAERHATYHQFRTTLNELSVLSDRDLADMGLHRSMLESVAWDAAKGNNA